MLSCFEVQKLRGISYNSQRLLDAVFYSSQKDQCRLFARVNWEFHVDEVVLVGWHWRDEDMWNSSTLILQWIPIHTWPEYDLSSQSFCLLNSLVWLVEFLEGVRSQCWWNEDVVGLVDKPTFGCQFLAVWVVRLYFTWNQYLMIWPPILYLLDQKLHCFVCMDFIFDGLEFPVSAVRLGWHQMDESLRSYVFFKLLLYYLRRKCMRQRMTRVLQLLLCIDTLNSLFRWQECYGPESGQFCGTRFERFISSPESSFMQIAVLLILRDACSSSLSLVTAVFTISILCVEELLS